MAVLPKVISATPKIIQAPPVDNLICLWVPSEMNISKRKPVQAFLKRVIDFTSSLAGLIILSPLLLLIAILIKLESKGPAIYKQKRVGMNGQPFYMYKFRTMIENADKLDDLLRHKYKNKPQIMFKLDNDPRITALGRFLRKYSLDEFPQLVNVIKGEMSLVGPRPTLPKVIGHLNRWHYIYFAAKPGITGMWQTNGRSSLLDFNRVVALEYLYIKNWNLFMDFKILLKTVPVVLSGKDAV
jgi:lipopolysaccharide/colanic/teichoic acid biosynthesis glycosyltransferase